MQKTFQYLKNVTIVTVSLYVIFVGALSLGVVLGGATWDEVKDWAIKALAVAGIFLAVNVIVAFVLGATRRNDA